MSTSAEAASQESAQLQDAVRRVRAEISKVIIGQDQVVKEVMIAILTRSHALLVGVPGLAKTLLISSLAEALRLSFKRIQFTPDLMPSDITGTEVIYSDPATNEREFKFLPGPIFANIILADEINRTPPKTQAAMLESMQERKVTVGGEDHPLPEPFFVLATQNPIEQEGTYPLPEAQLDRFMFMIRVAYPKPAEELAIAQAVPTDMQPSLKKVLRGQDILELQKIIAQVPVSDHVALYCVKLGRSTRPEDPITPAFIGQYVTWGIGPRAIQYLVLGAKARAALRGEYNVTTDHVREVAPLVLRHRIVANFHAEAEGIDTDQLVARLLDEVGEPTPDEYDALGRDATS